MIKDFISSLHYRRAQKKADSNTVAKILERRENVANTCAILGTAAPTAFLLPDDVATSAMIAAAKEGMGPTGTTLTIAGCLLVAGLGAVSKYSGGLRHSGETVFKSALLGLACASLILPFGEGLANFDMAETKASLLKPAGEDKQKAQKFRQAVQIVNGVKIRVKAAQKNNPMSGMLGP